MMMRFLFLFFVTALIFSSCDFNPLNSPDKSIGKSIATHQKVQSQKDSDNPLISVEPSEQVSLQDYWEEASAIQAEAQEILVMSTEIQCEGASKFANEASRIARKTRETKNFSEAEHLLGQAGEILQLAESALILCQDHSE